MKFYCTFKAAAFVLGAIFWSIVAKFSCHQKHQKLCAQKLLAKIFGEISHFTEIQRTNGLSYFVPQTVTKMCCINDSCQCYKHFFVLDNGAK
jgi:hypothetical protein